MRFFTKNIARLKKYPDITIFNNLCGQGGHDGQCGQGVQGVQDGQNGQDGQDEGETW